MSTSNRAIGRSENPGGKGGGEIVVHGLFIIFLPKGQAGVSSVGNMSIMWFEPDFYLYYIFVTILQNFTSGVFDGESI